MSIEFWLIPKKGRRRTLRLKPKRSLNQETAAMHAALEYSIQHPTHTIEVHINGQHKATFELGSLALGKGGVMTIAYPIEHGLIWRTIPK